MNSSDRYNPQTDLMNKKKLGNTGLMVTPVGMGVLTVGATQLGLPLQDGADIVRYALERGINFLDTAEFYETYEYMRRAFDDLKPAFSQNALPRPVIASKSLALSYGDMNKAIDECRKALDLDQIDIFLLHEVRESPDFEDRGGAWECLIDAKQKGLVKAIGISTHHVCAAAQSVGHTTKGDSVESASGTTSLFSEAAPSDFSGIDVLFPLINYQGLGIRKGSGPGTAAEMEAVIKSASKKSIGVFAMKAFGGGNLLREYMKALDYVASLEGLSSTMIGMGCKQDVDDAVSYFEGRLPETYQPDISDKRMFVDRGDCEGCGQCLDRCTSKAIRLDSEGIAVIDRSLCVLCGYCSPSCPVRALIML